MNRETVAFREVKRALSRFLQRAWLLLLPDILLSALSAGGGVLILRSVLILVAGIRLPLLLIIPAALTGAILCALLCRPGWKNAARMMDAAGFQDRAVTMLDCASEDTPMAVLQRTEALALAGQTDPRRVHRRHSRFLMILCPVLLSCALLLSAYEHTQLAEQTHVQEETEPPQNLDDDTEKESIVITLNIKSQVDYEMIKQKVTEIIDGLDVSMAVKMA